MPSIGEGDFETVKQAAEKLKSGMPVCIQFETSEGTKNLYLSFLKGVIFALDGSMSQLSAEAYIFTPKGVTVQRAD